MLVEILGYKFPSKESLWYNSLSMESIGHECPSMVGKLFTFCGEIIYKCDGKLSKQYYETNINLLVVDLIMNLG